MALKDHPMIIFDGACGTNLQLAEIPPQAWQGCEGCNELLNLTAPTVVEELHRRFYQAGSMVVETNTFGASRLVLKEYGLESRVNEINAAAVKLARRAAEETSNTYVAGAVGPTTKLVSLKHVGVNQLRENYAEQFVSLLEAGADALIIETCQDLLQVKLAVITALETMEKLGRTVPLMVSVTIERTGTMLMGSDIAAVAVTLEPFPIFSLGLNCATGPEEMESYLRYLHHNWPGRISCIPNQGLPEVVNGRTCYRMGPEKYARLMRQMVTQFGVSVVGGCCGTTPAHVAALVTELNKVEALPETGVADA